MLAGNATAWLVDDVEAAVDMSAATRASVSSPAVDERLAMLDDAATSALDVAAPRAVSSPELDWSLGDNDTRAAPQVTAAVADTTTSALDEATREGGEERQKQQQQPRQFMRPLHSFLLFLFERANLVLDIVLHLAEIEMAILYSCNLLLIPFDHLAEHEWYR